MTAWNTYMQAYLHFRPDMFYKLFAYQKVVCRLAAKYKFDACYAYDRDMRMSLAAELSVAPSQRSVKWEVAGQEYINIHLQDQLLPLPSTQSCFNCHMEGHFAGACPQKKLKNNIFSTSNTNTPTYLYNNARASADPQTQFNSSFSQPIPTTDMSIQGQNNFGKRPEKQVPCQRFNKSGFCAKPPCTFAHVCNKCGRNNHPGIRCFSKTSSTFLP